MRAFRVVVCYCALSITLTISSPAVSQCSPTSFTFSLISSRNRNGQWISQVQLEHVDDSTSLPWNVKVDHNSEQCNGIENVGIIATVSGDCKTGVFDISVSSYCTDKVRPLADYELISGLGYYKVQTAAETWDEARKICIREGTHLLILNSGAEMDAVKSIWKKHSNFTGTTWKNYIHVGAHDRFKEGDYVTILDQPLSETGYTVWDSYEPNNAGGREHCMSVKDTGGLNDIFCDLKLAFICEQEL